MNTLLTSVAMRLWRFLLAFTTLVCVASASGVEKPSTRPADATDPKQVLASLLQKPGLKLTNDAQSSTKTFAFMGGIDVPANFDGLPTHWLVACDGDHFAILGNAAGLPYFYLSDGLLIAFDPDKPGQLVMHQGGKVNWTFDQNGFDFTYDPKGRDNRIVFDPAGCFERVDKDAVKYDAEHRLLTAPSANGSQLVVVIAPGDAKEEYPIQEMAVTVAPNVPSKVAIGVVNVTCKPIPPGGVLGRTAADFKKLGLPIRELKDEELRATFRMMAPKEFAQSPEQKAAGEKLLELLKDATTQPASGSK